MKAVTITKRMQAEALSALIRRDPPRLRFTRGMAEHARNLERGR